MASLDRYDKNERHRMQRRGLSSEPSLRLELAKELLTGEKTALLRELADSFQIELYSFSREATEISPETTSSISPNPLQDSRRQTIGELEQRVSQFAADGSETNFRDSLVTFLDRESRDPLLAIVLITDGNPTMHQVDALADVGKRLRRKQIPVFSLGIGSSIDAVDLSIEEIDFEPVGFAGEEHPISVELTSNSTTDEPVTIVVRNSGNGTEVTSATVERLNADKQASVQVVLPELSVGWNAFDVEISGRAGESNQRNNSRHLRVWGRDASLKILLADEVPRWEYRHLKSTLERDPHVSLQTFLAQSDAAHALEDRSAINQLPESLSEFDAVILGDLDFAQLNPDFLNAIEKFLNEEQGGLMLLSGDRSLDSLDLTSTLAEIHPAIASTSDVAVRRPAQAIISAEGQAQKILPVGMKRDEFEGLPYVYPIIRDWELKTSALMLSQGLLQDNEIKIPLLLAMRYGKGIVLQLLFDDTWRWRAAENGEVYRKIWSQMIRNLCRQKLSSELPPLQLWADRDDYQEHEPVELQLIDRHNRYADRESVTIQLDQLDGTQRILSLQRAERTGANFSATLTDLPAGDYSASLIDSGSAEEVTKVKVSWAIHESRLEREYQPLNVELLKNLAEVTEGGFYYPWESDRLVEQLPRHTQATLSEIRIIPLWNRWEFLLLFLMMLSVEWVIRRRTGIE